jgi:iron complex transport system ATP-binding protein
MMEVINASFSINGLEIIKTVNITFTPHYFYALIGANGAGKSTLLNLLSGAILASDGQIKLNGQPIESFPLLELAKNRSFLQQKTEVEPGVSVREVLEMGRFPYKESIEQTEFWVNQYAIDFHLLPLLDKEFDRLSGGEQQRVQLARVLLQLENPHQTGQCWLFLDEPLNNLDLKYQREVLQAAQDFVRKGKGGVIAVMHDLNLCYRFADKVALMDKGQVLANGGKEVLKNQSLLNRVFDTRFEVFELGEKVFFEVWK